MLTSSDSKDYVYVRCEKNQMNLFKSGLARVYGVDCFYENPTVYFMQIKRIF